ncbi:MAG: hypothetical protein N2246_00455, partial [Candidatus Sumerlaeia bacterium]|nr:hypothetical protein [Candidatus Sumerlaeia bacterium]
MKVTIPNWILLLAAIAIVVIAVLTSNGLMKTNPLINIFISAYGILHIGFWVVGLLLYEGFTIGIGSI